jgi:hypothetical protein
MSFRVFYLLGLSITLAPALISTDVHIAQAGPCKQPCSPPITNTSGYKRGPSKLPADMITEGNGYRAKGENERAKQSYAEAYELATQSQDLKSQEAARKGLDDLSRLNAPSNLKNGTSLQQQIQLQNQMQK